MHPRFPIPALLLVAASASAQGTPTHDAGAHVPATPRASLTRGLVGLEALDADSLIGAGASYKVAFEPGEVVVTPFLGRAAPRSLPLGLALESVRLGAHPLVEVDAPIAPRREGDDVVYVHAGSVVERYELRSDGVYQSFTFETLPDVAGDLVVRTRLTTALTPRPATDGGLVLEAPGEGGLTYGAVVGIDGAGRTFAGTSRVDGDVLELVLPAERVAGAVLPLTLDPLIGSVFGVNTDAADEGDPDVAYSPTLNRSLVVWERSVSGTDSDVYGIQVQNGAPVGTLRLIETGPGVATNPSVGFVPVTSRFLVAWQDQPSFLSDSDVVGRTVGSNGNLGPNVTIAATAANERDPDVGGERTDVDDEAFVVWEEDGAGLLGIQVRLTAGNEGTVGPPSQISDVGAGLRHAAIASTTNADGHYLVVWEQDIGNLTKIRGRVVNRNGGLITGVEAISDPIGLDILSDSSPDVATDGDAWVAVWEENESAAGTSHDLEGVRLVRANNQLDHDSTVFEFEADADDDELRPCIAFTGASFTVAFLDQQGTEYDVYLKTLDPFTVRPAPEFAVDSGAAATEDVEIASRWGGGATSDETLVVWDSDELLFGESVSARVHEAPANVTVLGGDCGNGGSTFAPCPYAGNDNYRVHLRNATPGALAALAVAPTSSPVLCGFCAIFPNLATAQLVVPGVTSTDGHVSTSFPIPAGFGPATFYAQWGVFNGGGCGFFGGFDLSDALQVDVTAP